MRNQHILRDIADRTGTSFSRSGPSASTPAVIHFRTSTKLPGKSRQLANSEPDKSALRDVAELKICIDGLPFVLVFPIEGIMPKRPPCADRGRTDIHSLVSSALEKIVDRLRGSGRQVAISPSDAALKVNTTNLGTVAVAAPSIPETVLRVGPLELNLIDRTVKRGDRVIDLRPREFRLLRYMMERSDKLLTRAKLLQDVWNYKFVPQTNLVDVHMGRLRRKIDGLNEPAMIRSVRGAGFVLSVSSLFQH